MLRFETMASSVVKNHDQIWHFLPHPL